MNVGLFFPLKTIEIKEASQTERYKHLTSITSENATENFSNFMTQFLKTFKGGSKGSFDNKKQMISELRKKNPDTVFISFGSSGLSKSDACKWRKDAELGTIIVDVWSKPTIVSLDEKNMIDTVQELFAYKCLDATNIMGLRFHKSWAVDEISDVIFPHLKNESKF